MYLSRQRYGSKVRGVAAYAIHMGIADSGISPRHLEHKQ